jgi:hypothetical protein
MEIFSILNKSKNSGKNLQLGYPINKDLKMG